MKPRPKRSPLVYCPKCGTANDPDERTTCIKCGEPL